MASQVDEYTVRVPKQASKTYSVMRFNAGDRVDIRNWTEASLSRDLSAKKIYVEEEEFPEFGEGSEYGRKQREKARKLKYGRKESVFKVKDQPLNLKVSAIENQPDFKKKLNGKVPTDIKPKIVMKEFSGKKEGGIGEGSVYFVFTQRPDFTFEAYPVEDWYNFRRKISHRTLTDEEAEAAWDKRDKIMNHLNYMARKRLHIKEEEENEDAESKSSIKKSIKKTKIEASDLMIHDDEDLDLYMSDNSSDDDEPSGSKKKKKNKAKDKSDEERPEALEDSDDGEHEGDEVAYASDVSSENEEVNDSRVVPKGLDEVESSSSSSSEEEDEKKAEAKEDEVINKLMKGSDDSATSSESGSDIEEDDPLSKSALFMHVKKPKEKKGGKGSKQGSRSSTPTAEVSGTPTKSKVLESAKKLESQGRKSPLVTGSVLGKRSATSSQAETVVKRQKIGPSSSTAPNSPPKDSAQGGITEDAVRRYLTYKPITTKDLLKKFKTKKTGLASEEIVNRVVKILKRLNPDKRNINGKLHLFLEG